MNREKLEKYNKVVNLEERNAKLNLLLDAISVSTEKSDKKGYDWKITKLGEQILTKEYIKSEVVEENDGTDYLKPIVYSDGMSVTKDLWYTDGSDIWLAIKDGVPKDFSDEEYFDIIS